MACCALLLILYQYSYSQIKFSDFNTQMHYSEENGLGSNYITDIQEDKYGFLWLGTGNGVSRFDGSSFTNFEHFFNNSVEVELGFVNKLLFEDQSERLWVGGDQGIFYSSIGDIHFNSISQLFPGEKVQVPKTHDLLLDDQQTIWAASFNSGLSRFDVKNNRRETYTFINDNQSDNSKLNNLNCLSWDPLNNNILWIGSGAGLIRFNILTKEYHVYVYENNTQKAQNQIRKISATEDHVYLGTWSEGFVIFNKEREKFSQPLKRNFPNSHQLVLDFYVDNDSILWVATGHGLVQYDIESNKIESVSDHDLAKGLIKGISFIDSRGIIWFGYGKGLFKYDPLQSQSTFIKLEERSSLENSMFVREIIFSNGYFFVLGHASSGLYKVNPRDKTFEVIEIPQLKPKVGEGYNLRDMTQMDNGSLILISSEKIIIFNPYTNESELSSLQIEHPHPSLQTIIRDSNNNFWVGGREGGLFCLNFENNSIVNYKEEFDVYEDGNHRWINSLYLDSNDKLWIGKGNTNSIMDLDEQPVIRIIPEDKNKLNTHQDVGGFYEDVSDRVWVAGYHTGLGFTDYKNFNNGISHQVDGYFSGVYALNDSILWTTGNSLGMLNINTATHSSVNLNSVSSQLKIRGPVLAYGETDYIIGCENGVAFYDLTDQEAFHEIPIPYIKSISGNGKQLYQGNKIKTKNLTFNSGTNHLVIDVSSLGFHSPDQIHYEYKIQDHWISLGSSNEINFTNLSQGEYSFSLKACNSSGLCNEIPVAYTFNILAHWYKSWWAYVLYGILFWTIAALLYQFDRHKRKAIADKKKAIEYQVIKSHMYENISHELRTPLTVILGMADTLKANIRSASIGDSQKLLEMIDSNGKKLLQLVNEMLDLTKLESGYMELDLIQADVISFLKYLTESFQSLADQKGINLIIYSEINYLEMDFDSNKLGSIVSNLLSNAIKFTPGNGKIILHIHSNQEKEIDSLYVKVQDSGPGLSEENVLHIFDKFYQANNLSSKDRLGTGIGLSLTKELVILMGGKINVKSTIGKGSTFSFYIPITKNAPKRELSQIPFVSPILKQKHKTGNQNILKDSESKLPLALIIEDNPDVVYYLKTCLKGKYDTIHAIDGIQGIEMAVNRVPDIIISDVMMPGKDGFEVCATLKADEVTNHIPIILLTAKATKEDRLEGLSHGADAYLSKPFEKAELYTRLDQLVAIRKTILQKFEKIGINQLMKKRVESLESKFLQNAISIIHDHLSDHSFGASQLAQKLQLSESQVYRKLKAITGKSTAVFIRFIRLEKGKELIQITDKNISEVAYEVGFEDPSWFSRAFKEEYGSAPSFVRK
jgi:signal transduction histidine kinase/AraC-like DNA-binding protein/ligand-binding sensor domain-containing protein